MVNVTLHDILFIDCFIGIFWYIISGSSSDKYHVMYVFTMIC